MRKKQCKWHCAQALPRATADPIFPVTVRHRILIMPVILAVVGAVVALSVYGVDYYRLPPVLRARSPKHAMLRSSGWAGIRTGVLGALGLRVLYLYAFHKNSARLGRIGRTNNWLDYRVIAGVSVPILVTSHSLARPLQVASLRRQALSGWQRVVSLGGLLASRNPDLERVVELARRQARPMVKIAFLDRAHEIFHLWHVVHRPFSYSLAALVALHLGVEMLFGYF
ncbi:MAG: hypothetical protein Q8N47_01430 [Bryobacterales bacterium]|nr:hypothetical protein [Bryobacterales bacterium]